MPAVRDVSGPYPNAVKRACRGWYLVITATAEAYGRGR